jgi:UPF0176 protein
MITVAAFYRFIKLNDVEKIKNSLFNLLSPLDVKGTIILASEGINGTIAGSFEATLVFKDFLANDSRLALTEYKESFYHINPFQKLKIKIKPEIVTMGRPNFLPNETGIYVNAKEWNQLIKDPSVMVIDVRNDFEVKMGSFIGAINPHTKTFRDFPDFVKQNLPDKSKTIAMSCTGGIRCEKASAYLKQEGFSQVFQLKGGVLQYLKDMPKEKSLWQGSCFVFDKRIAVDRKSFT